MRLIDADELEKKLDKMYAEVEGHDFGNGERYFIYQDAIVDVQCAKDELPTIDAEPVKHSEWIERKVISRDEAEIVIDEWQSAKCSVCGRYHTTPYLYSFYEDNYCPYCGAKMERREQ